MNSDSLYVDVLLPLSLPVLYTYKVPERLKAQIKPGIRVTVQFGPKRMYSALVRKVHAHKPVDYPSKEILNILENKPVVSELQFKFWEWIADYYLCALGDIMNAALPSGMKLESHSRIFPDPKFRNHESLNEDEIRVLHSIDEKGIRINEAVKIKGVGSAIELVNSLILKKAVIAEEKLIEKYKPKSATYIRINTQLKEKELGKILDNLKRAPKQKEAILNLISESNAFHEGLIEEISKASFMNKFKCSPGVVKSLVEKGIFESYQKVIGRISIDEKFPVTGLKELTRTQDAALKTIDDTYHEKDVVLLNGITSSGKTEIYTHLIDKQIKAGKQVLYLLPEIAVTAQIVQRLRSVFGSAVGIYHSRLNDAERVEIWKNILEKEKEESFKIILGARSAIFLPFSNLGLIIVDEEHENTYKQQDPSPRYHARDSAIVLAGMHNAKVLLGTATPSIESYYNARTGKFGYVELNERYEKLQLPEVVIADLYKAFRKRTLKAHFTPELMEAMEEALGNDEQVILFQNRRGFSPFLECGECKHVPQCKHCAVSLTYHRQPNRLVCHHCGYNIANPGNCLNCGSQDVKTKGFGTEKIEEELAILFPEAKIGRMDFDTTRKKQSYERILHEFEQNRMQILVGTQMISKGLDFKNVFVVGILNADNMLNFPDFRAVERSFQLMSQVSGRAGRTRKQGKVIIQTSNPGHPVIQDVVHHDYDHMYRNELKDRKNFHYPPITRLIQISLKHYDAEKLNRASLELVHRIKTKTDIMILGPEAPLVNRIQRKYIQVILIKIKKQHLSQQSKSILAEVIHDFEKNSIFRSVQVSIDVDPM